ncbi:MAG: glycosyltransferase [Bacillota bacterium]
MLKILVASPVRQKPAVLKEFLWSLEQLETTGMDLAFVFVDDNDEESDLLRNFAAGRTNVRIFRGGTSEEYRCDENTHHWRDSLVWKVAAYKDRFIDMAKDEGFNFLFLVDSDLVLHPKTLIHLAGLGKDIVSEVFWTRWQPELPPLPQVWVAHDYRLYEAQRDEVLDNDEMVRRISAFLKMLQQPGTYKVGGLGACTLISRKAILMGVSFKEIYNLDLTGEDRHFCIRAAALGLELYADTYYPPYHIYRESELAGLEAYKNRHFSAAPQPASQEALQVKVQAAGRRAKRGSRITLAMLVRNEAGRYLERVLKHAARYVDSAVILDDASDDNTVEVCRTALGHILLTLVSNGEPSFSNEIVLRKQLWNLAVGTDPDWILVLDADEIFEDRAVQELRGLAANPGVEVYSFRLYDMWDEQRYREDAYWTAHRYHRPFMVRYVPGFNYEWQETPQHCGRFPRNITQLKGAASDLRVKHLGWMKPADRLAKYYRYKQLDPQGRYGIMEQYLSILDPKPNLVAWTED